MATLMMPGGPPPTKGHIMTKREAITRIKTEIDRRRDIAARMRFGKARACEFAYLCALTDCVGLLEGAEDFTPMPG